MMILTSLGNESQVVLRTVVLCAIAANIVSSRGITDTVTVSDFQGKKRWAGPRSSEPNPAHRQKLISA